MSLYRVKDWDDHFENNRTRTIDACTHVWVRNKQHGLGFTFILSQPDGAAILGIWYLIIEACSLQRLPRQGYLTDTGTSLGRQWDVTTMSLRWRRKPDEIQRALDILSSQDVDWMEVAELGVTTASVGRHHGVNAVRPIQRQRQEQIQKQGQTLLRGGDVPDFVEKEETYKKHPLLKVIHSVPMLRNVTLEIWLKCVSRRSKCMDWQKAVKFVCDKAELQIDILKPGAFLDSHLSYYERDHMTEIRSREAAAVRREAKKKELIAFITEWENSGDPQADGAIKHAIETHRQEFGQQFTNEVESERSKKTTND